MEDSIPFGGILEPNTRNCFIVGLIHNKNTIVHGVEMRKDAIDTSINALTSNETVLQVIDTIETYDQLIVLDLIRILINTYLS